MSSALQALPPAVLIAVFALLGACIGSFLNVVIARVPKGESIIRPGSHCACGAPIAWRDNLPVLSWLLLRGRARCCRRPISARYALIELATAALFAAAWLRARPDMPAALCAGGFLAALLAASAIDAGHMIIPEALTLGTGVAAVVLSFLVPTLHPAALPEGGGPFLLLSLSSGTAALTGLCVGSGLCLWIASLAGAVLRRDAMGMGDVLFVGAIGAFCGWHGAVVAIFGGASLGILWVLLLLTLRRGPALNAKLPFGPMLAAGAALYLLVLRGPVDAWFARVAALFG